MIDRFCYDVYVPSAAREIKFYELDNAAYMTILKFIQNNDDDGLCMFLEGLIETLCVDYRDCNSFNRLDKYCIVLSMIMIGVGNVLEYNVTCAETEQEYKIEIKINEIISKINNLDIKPERVSLSNDGEVSISCPRSLSSRFASIISSVKFGNKTYDVSTMNEEQLDTIISTLPYNVFDEIKQQYRVVHEQCDKIVYYTYKSPYVKDAKETEYRFNLFDNSFFDFIKLLLNEDLLNYYKVFYSITTKFKFDMQYVQSITPSETKMYMSFIREDIKRKQDQIESAKNKSSTGIPLAMPTDPANDD